MKRGTQWLFVYFVDFCSINFLLHFEKIKFLLSIFFLLMDMLIFLSVMTNNETKCGVIYEKTRADDDERMIYYEWP